MEKKNKNKGIRLGAIITLLLAFSIFYGFPIASGEVLESSAFTQSSAGLSSSFIENTNNNPTGVIFSTDGLTAYSSGYNNGNYPYNSTIYQFSLSSPFDLTTITYLGNHINNSFNGDQLNSFYITPNGTDLYTAMGNYSSAYPAYLTASYILHFKMTANNISSAVVKEKFLIGTFAINGIYVSDNGSSAIISDVYFDGVTKQRLASYLMSSPYNASALSRASGDYNVQLQNNVNAIMGIYVMNSGTKLFAINTASAIGNPHTIREYNITSPYNVSTAFKTGELSFTEPIVKYGFYGTQTQWFTIGQNQYSVTDFDIRKYLFNTTFAVAINDSSGAGFINNAINGISSLFPKSSTLTFVQRITWSFFILVATSLIIAIAFTGMFKRPITKGEGYFIAFINLVAFFYLVSIGYIPIIAVILLTLITIGVLYLLFKNK